MTPTIRLLISTLVSLLALGVVGLALEWLDERKRADTWKSDALMFRYNLTSLQNAYGEAVKRAADETARYEEANRTAHAWAERAGELAKQRDEAIATAKVWCAAAESDLEIKAPKAARKAWN